MKSIVDIISLEMSIQSWQATNTIKLIEDGATIPFIARYRKEMTGNLTDIQLLSLQKLIKKHQQLEERKKTVLSSIEEQGLLSDELKARVERADSINQLEDIYLPYKRKRKTRADKARSRGLEPLAKMIMSENVSGIEYVAKKYLSEKNEVLSVEDALQGARDIIAEWVNEKESVRKSLRRLFEREAEITSKVAKDKEAEGEKFESYFDWKENASKSPSHRILAMFRGEVEGVLKIKIIPDPEKAIQIVESRIIRGRNEAAEQKVIAIKDAVKRLLLPSIESAFRAELKQKADEVAVSVFSENLSQLLLAAPLGQKNVLAIDPGFRTGCKIVCLDQTGRLMNNDTIFPHPPQHEAGNAMKKLKTLVNAYKIEAIAIGNGTAGRETEELIRRIRFDRETIAVMVNESGASVYSASETARNEFPEYDVTVRGAVSIGRRLMDPLAELVKIDPKAIGVGQYQHDVNQALLRDSLQTTVELCVNHVGVELNTASKELLACVSGIGPKLAEQIVTYRNEKGRFVSREELKKVKGLGEKAYEQSAGFLRIKDGSNLLDASAVHPESYGLVKRIAKKIALPVNDMIGNRSLKSLINANDFVTDEVGLPTVQDILTELEKPGRDPRKMFKMFSFDKNIKKIEDIRAGMTLPAIVTNITDFGAFVDLGVHESGLIHKSQIAEEYVKNPADHLHLNQQLMVSVLEVDLVRKRIALSLIGVD